MSDPVRRYTDGEEKALASNLRSVLERIHSGEESGRPPTQDWLCDIHRGIFGGVREFAGRIRRRGDGAEWLTFGPNRSVHRDGVEAELAGIFRVLRVDLRKLLHEPNAPDYELSALRLAVRTHAEIVRVHPFEDGNGRSSRALMNWILVAAGMRPIAIEVPKQEYHECLNRYFESGDDLPLIDLALRCVDLTASR